MSGKVQETKQEFSKLVVTDPMTEKIVSLDVRVGESLGTGCFGRVVEFITDDERKFAAKQIKHGKKTPSRELEILKGVKHINIANLKYYYMTDIDQDTHSVTFLLEKLCDNLNALLTQFRSSNKELPDGLIQVVMFQLLRGTAYLHSVGILHRDLKPDNIIYDSKTYLLKICDFGSAIRNSAEDKKVAYICSRYYRAPELLLGSCRYSYPVDIWSIGCIFLELFHCKPIFCGEDTISQFVEIVSILGSPTLSQLQELNPALKTPIPYQEPKCIADVCTHPPSRLACHLIISLLQYAPSERYQCWFALSHPFFENLRTNCHEYSRYILSTMFTFTSEELQRNPLINQFILPCKK